MLVLALLWAVGCNREVPQKNHGLAATEGDRVEVAGPETWSVNGNDVPVLGTYYMVLEAGVEYVIEVAKEPSPAALEVDAWPIIRYAFENRRYLRSRVNAYGQRAVEANRIRIKFGSAYAPYRNKPSVTLGISEVRYRINEERNGR
jgi:hypothetical protein